MNCSNSFRLTSFFVPTKSTNGQLGVLSILSIRQRGMPSEDTSIHPLPSILVSYRALGRLAHSFCSIFDFSFLGQQKRQIDFCFLSACVSDIYFSGVQVYPQRENGDFTSAFGYREKSPFGQQKSPIHSGFSQETSFLPPHYGPSVEIRTQGLLNPIQARYQTSPHPDSQPNHSSQLDYYTTPFRGMQGVF